MKTVSSYKEKHFPFPNMDASLEEKSKESYALSTGKAIYSTHLRNRTGVSYTYSTAFGELRKFGRGIQDEERYKNFLSGKNTNSSGEVTTDTDGSWTQNREYERKGWMNVLWDIISPANKIRNMIHGMFDEVDFDVMVDAVDADSGAEEEDKKWRLWSTTRSLVAQQLARMKAQAGLPQEQPDFIPESLDELEMYANAGGFKQAYSMALEKLIRHTDDVSDWENIKRKLVDDIIDLNIASVKCDYSDDEKKVKWRYADPEDLVIQYSKYEDYRDSEYAGEFKDITISELRRSLFKEGLSEDDVNKIAAQNVGYKGNPSSNEWGEYNKLSSSSSWGYDYFKTCIFAFEWIDHTKEKKIKYVNKYGKTRWLPYTKGQKLGNRETLVTTAKRTLYQGHWVVGTDYVFDFGPVYYQPRPQPKRVELTYKVFKLEGKSITGILMPVYDNIQLGWLKYQNALNTIFEEGYAVDWRMLQNISDGNKKFSAQEAIKMWRETGILPFMSTPVGQFYRGGAVLPAHKLPGGMGESLNQAVIRLNIQMKLIEDLTGLSPVALGGSPDPNAPVGTTERSLQATHNSLKPMIRSVFYLKNNLGVITGSRIQQLLKYDKESRKQYTKVIGAQDVESIMMARDNSVEYGYRMESRPTMSDKQQLLRSAEIAMAPGRNGQPGLEFSDYTYIVERLMGGGNLKEIRLYLVSAQKKTKRQQFQEQMQIQQQAGQQQQQAKQQQLQGDMMKLKADTESKMMMQEQKHKNDMELKVVEMNADYMKTLMTAKESERSQLYG